MSNTAVNDMNHYQLQRFASRDELEQALCAEITQLMANSIIEQGSGQLVVSGGSTPLGLFKRLSHTDLPWYQVTVSLADERWVAADDKDSNERLVRECLLKNNAAAAQFAGLKTDAPDADAAVTELNAKLLELGAADILILGMGNDGHTASLFPCSQQLAQALTLAPEQACCAVTPGSAPHRRISLTLGRLLASKRIFLHLVGEEKLAVFKRALEPGPVEEMPIRAVLRRASPGIQVFWAP